MSLTLLTRLADIPASQWDALTPNDQPFLRHAFLRTLEESGSVGRASGWQPQHLLWIADGIVRAALPGYAKSHSMGEYVFDHGWAEACQRAGVPYYPKWLSAVPFSPVSGARLLGDDVAAAQCAHKLQRSARAPAVAAGSALAAACWLPVPLAQSRLPRLSGLS